MNASLFGRDPSEIERAIESTRHELDRTLDALQAKLSPRQRLGDAMETARDTARDALGTARTTSRELAGNVQEMVRRDPMPFVVVGATLLVAIVAGALMRRRGYY